MIMAMSDDKRTLVNFVCTANICRSPMAEYLFNAGLAQRQDDLFWRNFKGVSSGVSASDGEAISRNSLLALRELGIEAESHQSQYLSQGLLDRSRAVFCMTSTHKLLIEMHYQVGDTPVHLLREFIHGKAFREVPDPYGAELSDYRLCRESIAEAMPSIFDYLRKLPN